MAEICYEIVQKRLQFWKGEIKEIIMEEGLGENGKEWE